MGRFVDTCYRKQTAINNQLKAAAATAAETATMTPTTMTKSTKAMAAARWWQRGQQR